jgi:hypothetical protein
MPSSIVRNENYRDEVIKFAYPFDENSSLEDGELFIGTDLFLDAVLYLKEPAELPVHISEVDGTFGELGDVRFLLSDNSGQFVGQAAATLGEPNCNVLNRRGVVIGTFVFDQAALNRFVGKTAGKIFNLLSDVAAFALDACHVVRAPHLRYIAVEDQQVHGDVRLIAGHGVYFEDNDGVLSLNIVGDPGEGDAAVPVRSINGVRNPSIWLAAHPQANLRISNEGGSIQFVQARDATR